MEMSAKGTCIRFGKVVEEDILVNVGFEVEGVVCECSEDTGEDKQERRVGVGMRSIDED